MLSRLDRPTVNDFRLADTGRQFWMGDFWLAVGRHKYDNEVYAELQRPEDLHFKLAGFPGPIAIGRSSRQWDEETIRKAASLVASYSPKAVKAGEEGQSVGVRVTQNGKQVIVSITPCRESDFAEPTWEDARDELYALRKPAKKNEEQAEAGLE